MTRKQFFQTVIALDKSAGEITNHIRKQLGRENLDGRYYAASDHIWLGMHDIWWCLGTLVRLLPVMLASPPPLLFASRLLERWGICSTRSQIQR